MDNKEFKIALVIKTDGLEYDDRVRKEILTIQRLYPNIRFHLFVMLPDNKDDEGITSYGVSYRSVYLPAREKYPSAERTSLKAFQFYRSVRKSLKQFDAVWAADVETAFVPMLLKSNRILWDLHELPSQFMGNPLKRHLLRYIFSRCKVVLHANPQRVNFMVQQGFIPDITKHYALRNYPSFSDIDENYDDKYHGFIAWKDGRKCVYLQGLDGSWRAGYECVKSVLMIPDFAAVVIGVFDPQIKQQLKDEFGDELEKRVLFVGRVPQLKIPQYVRECYTSLVFYKNVSPNNYYCEANRFYQSVIMGLPVVVGDNPPMKALVEEYGLGVSIDDDGSNVDKIVDGLNRVISHYDLFKKNNNINRNKLLWDNQEGIIKEIVERLFD